MDPAGIGMKDWALTRLLFDPTVRLRTREERRAARLVAMVVFTLVVLTALGLALWFVDPGRILAPVDAATAAASLVLFLTAYMLARRGMSRTAIWLAIVAISAADFFLTFAGPTGYNPLYSPSDASALVFLVVAVVLADAFLSRREVLTLTGLYVVGMLALPLAVPKVDLGKLMSGPLTLLVVTAILVVIVTAHRRRVENERSSLMVEEIDRRREMQVELSRHRDELEVLVEERTMGLEAANAELRDANAAKDRFLANMSHELRTPLNSIIGFTGVMRQGLAGPLTEEQSRQLGMVARSSRHLLALIDQVLDHARIEAGQESLDVTTFPLLGLVREAAEEIEPLAQAKGLEVVVDDSRVPEGAHVTTDRGKVKQILLNLAGNAVKFTESGRIVVRSELDGDDVRLTVSDTGVGIHDDELAAVFDEYRQVMSHDGAKPLGTGLGLTVSRRLARLLGGDIEVRSELGVGSEFSVTVTRV
jgi:signal transduction histidine kinase